MKQNLHKGTMENIYLMCPKCGAEHNLDVSATIRLSVDDEVINTDSITLTPSKMGKYVCKKCNSQMYYLDKRLGDSHALAKLMEAGHGNIVLLDVFNGSYEHINTITNKRTIMLPYVIVKGLSQEFVTEFCSNLLSEYEGKITMETNASDESIVSIFNERLNDDIHFEGGYMSEQEFDGIVEDGMNNFATFFTTLADIVEEHMPVAAEEEQTENQESTDGN